MQRNCTHHLHDGREERTYLLYDGGEDLCSGGLKLKYMYNELLSVVIFFPSKPECCRAHSCVHSPYLQQCKLFVLSPISLRGARHLFVRGIART